MRQVIRLAVMIVGAILGGILARMVTSDLALVGMVAGAMLGWLVTGEPLARFLRKEEERTP
ncbi:MAG: hypothetical protein AB7R89_31585 [Dehalococcoidia bacterium]